MEKVRANLVMSPEMADLIDRLANETGSTKSDVIRKAINLLEVAVEARKAGRDFGVARAGVDLDTKIVGI
jgi:predicted transcriptional regulator